MAHRRFSLREKLVTLAADYTQKQIARKLGVTDRTIRRWKNEGVIPSEPRPQKKLQVFFEREHKRIAEEIRRDRRKHPGAPRIERKLKILPPGKRRILKVYERGRDTGRERASEWINYHVEKMNVREVFELVRALRDEERIVQLIYRVPKGSRYPKGIGGRPGRQVRKSTRSGSPPLDLSNLDDGELMDFLLQYVDAEPTPKSRKLLYVSALDRKPAQ